MAVQTTSEFNLSFAPPEEKRGFLGPFQHARSLEESNREAIAVAIRASIVFVAVKDGDTVGVLRGKEEKLQSLFVRGAFHKG